MKTLRTAKWGNINSIMLRTQQEIFTDIGYEA